MAKILNFGSKPKSNERTHFTKAVLDMICDSEKESYRYEMYIEDSNGDFYEIDSAYIGEGFVSIQMGRSLSRRQI